MNIPLFVFSLLLFVVELYIAYDTIANSEKKIRNIVIASLIIIFSFVLVYTLATIPIAWKIAKICAAIYGAIMLLLFVLGHIVMAINRNAGDKIADLFAELRFLVFIILPLIPPAILYTSVGILK